MKYITIIFKALAIASMILSTSCDREDALIVELIPDKYDISDSSDPVQHAKAELYKKYKTYLITTPTTTDYMFNFNNKNNIHITQINQDQLSIVNAINALQEFFLDKYSEDFLAKHSPYAIILADSIKYLSYQDFIPNYYGYASKSFLAIGGLNEPIATMLTSKRDSIIGEVNAKYWLNYMGSVKNIFQIPDEFFEISENYYGKNWSDNPNTIDFYELGLIGHDPLKSIYDEIWNEWWTEAPNKDKDAEMWIHFVFSSSQQQINMLLEKYPLMKQKYDILVRCFLACDYDIRQTQKQ